MTMTLQSGVSVTKADEAVACQQTAAPGLHSRRTSLVRLLASAAIGYAVGSFSSADAAGRLARGNGTDLRQEGSGNPGAMNAGLVLGPRWGWAVLVGDVFKGVVASSLGRVIAGDDGAYVAGAASVAGHAYPAQKGFCGGKGVATSLGTAAVCMPAYAPLDVAIAGASYVTAARANGESEHVDTGVSAWMGTFAASAAFVLTAVATWRLRWKALWGPTPSVLLPVYALLVSGVILVRFLSARSVERE